MTTQHTPLMAQYHQIKQQYPEALLFFQVGDFYELFFDDAVRAAQFLAITLTKRGKTNGMDIPLCGVPLHAASFYITKLVKAGFVVALCDQRSKPQPGTVVERAVTKVYTPGTLTDDHMLTDKKASYLCALALVADQCQIVVLELLTAHLLMTSIPAHDVRSLEAELARYFPDEIILFSGTNELLGALLKKWGYRVTIVPESGDALALVHSYLSRVHPAIVSQLSVPAVYAPEHYVMLDAATQRNIALLYNADDGASAYTVCNAIDETVTAMGARLLKKWLVRPLRTAASVYARHDVVTLFVDQPTVRARFIELLKSVGDIERIIGRIALARASHKDYGALRNALVPIAQIGRLVASFAEVPILLQRLVETFDAYSQLYSLLTAALYEGDNEWLIKEKYDVTLDELRLLASDGHACITRYAAEQAALHDISSLKVLYTSVAGYFIEITKTHTHKVPEAYRHIQTLAGRERYVTGELSALEQRLHTAHVDAVAREKELYAGFEQAVAPYVSTLRVTASGLAALDVLVGFATVAHTRRYVRPEFVDEKRIEISAGRHPVVEFALSAGQSFTANDTVLTPEGRVWMVTGPNMGGKSTYLRQVALISLLAQCGSFVPATAARLMLVDRIFTRIGAGDNVAQGKSTFLIEMEEAATICTQATAASLVILDEVGRGTSTEDGKALAQAIIEYLVHTVGSLTLFATHYHELTHLANHMPAIANYHMVCVKQADTLHFLHRIEAGVAKASFGIEVAQLAALPASIIKRARELVS